MKYKFIKYTGLIIATCIMTQLNGQINQKYEIPPIPDKKGRAGMFVGISNNNLIIAGGANFPDKYPWENGKKKWYNDIFILKHGEKKWTKSTVKLPEELGYGVSTSYKDKIYWVGGSTPDTHSSQFSILKWDKNRLIIQSGPPLPFPLANMGGTNVNSLFIITGGMHTPTGQALSICYGIDLDHIEEGWFELPTWNSYERILPVTGNYNGDFYLFSGETTLQTSLGTKYRHILQDAYKFTPIKKDGKWSGKWSKLADIPRGMSAGPNPVPIINNKFCFSGGVDKITALHTDPQTHPGIDSTIIWFDPENERWSKETKKNIVPARVTLPTIEWNGLSYYISGEIKPGIRTTNILNLNEALNTN